MTHQGENRSTFWQRLIDYETDRHLGRLAELDRMRPLILQIEPVAAALEERGVSLRRDNYLKGFDGCLQLSSGNLPANEAILYDALLDLGFIEIRRDALSRLAGVVLLKGGIRISMLIPAGHTYRQLAQEDK